jgi:predicted P-loop ATPase
MKPGSKVDTMIVLEGEQGKQKSTALRELAGEKWFADTGFVPGEKDSYMALRGVWIYELAELSALLRAGVEVERAKNFISSKIDRYRPPYSRRVRSVPRQTVFAGTTNADRYLLDATGNRRYWPVKTGFLDIEAIRADRAQLWAEALRAYDHGEPWYLTDKAVEASAQVEQQARHISDDWSAVIDAKTRIPQVDLIEDGISTYTILTDWIHMAPERVERRHSQRIAALLHERGWTRRRVRFGKVLEWRYFAPSGEE